MLVFGSVLSSISAFGSSIFPCRQLVLQKTFSDGTLAWSAKGATLRKFGVHRLLTGTPHMLHVWNIYLHLVNFYGKCREILCKIFHTWAPSGCWNCWPRCWSSRYCDTITHHGGTHLGWLIDQMNKTLRWPRGVDAVVTHTWLSSSTLGLSALTALTTFANTTGYPRFTSIWSRGNPPNI